MAVLCLVPSVAAFVPAVCAGPVVLTEAGATGQCCDAGHEKIGGLAQRRCAGAEPAAPLPPSLSKSATPASFRRLRGVTSGR